VIWSSGFTNSVKSNLTVVSSVRDRLDAEETCAPGATATGRWTVATKPAEEGHRVGVPSALGRLALRMLFGAPVDVCSSTGSAVTVSTGSVSSTSRTAQWVGSATAVSLASWLSGVRRWRGSTALVSRQAGRSART